MLTQAYRDTRIRQLRNRASVTRVKIEELENKQALRWTFPRNDKLYNLRIAQSAIWCEIDMLEHPAN